MKKLITLLTLAGLASVASAEVLLDYQFNDANGTEFQNAVYSSDVTFSSSNIERDGNDEWLTTNGALRVVQTSGQAKGHYWQLANTITSGVITIDFAFDSYDLSGVGAAVRCNYKFLVQDDSSAHDEAGISLRHGKNTGDTVVRAETSSGVDGASRGLTVATRTYGRTILDLDSDLASAYESDDGTNWTAIVEDDAISLTASGAVYRVALSFVTDKMSASDYIDVDYFTVTHAIPEPATLGLIATMAGIAVFIRRRFMI